MSYLIPSVSKAISDALPVFRDANCIGWGQSWKNVTSSRTGGTVYQNTTGRPIEVVIRAVGDYTAVSASSDNVVWRTVGGIGGSYNAEASFSVPDGHYYKTNNGGAGINVWSELR